MTNDYEAEVRKTARVLSEIAHALEAADGVDERVHHVLDLLGQLVPFRQCALLEVTTRVEPTLFVVPAVTGSAERKHLETTLLRIFRLVAEAEEIGRSGGATPQLALPVMGLDQVIGAIRVEPPEDTEYDARHLRLLSVVAAQLGAYLTMLQLREDEARRTKELAKALEFQQILLGVVGHDLRNPLAVITTVAAQLLKTTADPRQATNIARALRNAEKANRIITDLLDATHIRVTGQLPVTKQRVELPRLIEEAVDDARVHGAQIDLVVRAADEGAADCDPVRLTQLATNLIANAVTHGERGAVVRVELSLGSSGVSLSVHNRGPTIPEEFLPLVFDPFKQGNQQRRGAAGGGLGLGLYIVNQIARAHGGRVDVQSTAVAGTTFTVTFPRWRVACALPALLTEESRNAEDAGARPTVLVVDDDDDIREGMVELLESHGFATASAPNGADALALLRAGLRPKLVLLDLWMPIMDGETFCNVLQADPELSSIPVCVISADAARAVRLTRSLGAAAYLQKPVRDTDLLRTLQRVAH